MQKTARKYSRIAGLYDLFEWPIERLFFHRLRKEAVQHSYGKTLELGVGTGKNLPFYPPDQSVTAIDFSPGMLKRARARLQALGHSEIELEEMDAQALSLEDNSFDSSLSTFVFCTIPQPELGLSELYRVLKPGARAVFLEHQRSGNPLVNLLLNMMDPFMRLLLGTSMVRDTQHNIEAAGFEIERVEFKTLDVVRLIIARKPER
ncbi:MAG: methyltransferase domain-containing protein [Gammaproteobacteria bacterium]|nr:methyltransferase domain-containing protein [Gammaproteobacteria bacterium]